MFAILHRLLKIVKKINTIEFSGGTALWAAASQTHLQTPEYRRDNTSTPWLLIGIGQQFKRGDGRDPGPQRNGRGIDDEVAIVVVIRNLLARL